MVEPNTLLCLQASCGLNLTLLEISIALTLWFGRAGCCSCLIFSDLSLGVYWLCVGCCCECWGGSAGGVCQFLKFSCHLAWASQDWRALQSGITLGCDALSQFSVRDAETRLVECELEKSRLRKVNFLNYNWFLKFATRFQAVFFLHFYTNFYSLLH